MIASGAVGPNVLPVPDRPLWRTAPQAVAMLPLHPIGPSDQEGVETDEERRKANHEELQIAVAILNRHDGPSSCCFTPKGMTGLRSGCVVMLHGTTVNALFTISAMINLPAPVQDRDRPDRNVNIPPISSDRGAGRTG